MPIALSSLKIAARTHLYYGPIARCKQLDNTAIYNFLYTYWDLLDNFRNNKWILQQHKKVCVIYFILILYLNMSASICRVLVYIAKCFRLQYMDLSLAYTINIVINKFMVIFTCSIQLKIFFSILV